MIETDWSSVVLKAGLLSMYKRSPEYLSTSGSVTPVAVNELPVGSEKISPEDGVPCLTGIANIPELVEETTKNFNPSELLVITVSSVNKLLFKLPDINQQPDPTELLKYRSLS